MSVDHINLINTRHHLFNAVSYCEPECHDPIMRAVYHLVMTALKLSHWLAYPRARK